MVGRKESACTHRGERRTGNLRIASLASDRLWRNREKGRTRPLFGRNSCSWAPGRGCACRWPVQVGKCLLRRSSRAGSCPHSRASRRSRPRSSHNRDRTLDRGTPVAHRRPRQRHPCRRARPLPRARPGPPNPERHRVPQSHEALSRRRDPRPHRVQARPAGRHHRRETPTGSSHSRSQPAELPPATRSPRSRCAVGNRS